MHISPADKSAIGIVITTARMLAGDIIEPRKSSVIINPLKEDLLQKLEALPDYLLPLIAEGMVERESLPRLLLRLAENGYYLKIPRIGNRLRAYAEPMRHNT